MPKADVIFSNAKVITMDERYPSAEIVAVKDNKIYAVGNMNDLETLAGVGTRVIDCQGKTLVPGFNDAHIHLFSLIKKLLSIDVSPASVHSIADIKEVIREKAAATPPNTWLSGTDYNEFYLEEKRCPTRWDLDEAAPDHPVILSHRSLHACVLNSLALSLAGIDRDTEEPPGARIERDLETGEPNGILVDMLSHIRSGVMPAISGAELEDGVSMANRLFLSFGVTSVQDATVNNGTNRWETVCAFILNRWLRSRMTLMAGALHWTEFQEMKMKTGSGDDLMRLGAIKFLLEIQPDQAQLNQLVLQCHHTGFQLAFHAVAESTIAAAITALEYADKNSSVVGRRHRIEHCTVCSPYLLERLIKLKATIVTHPAMLYYSGERHLATLSPQELPWLSRIKALLDSSLVVAAASDTPVTPVNPLVGIYAAVTRKAESGQLLQPDEAVSSLQALRMYTINGAYASFEEDIKGSITPGKLADMVVLSDNPLEVPPEQIKDIRVEMTIIGGEIVWES